MTVTTAPPISVGAREPGGPPLDIVLTPMRRRHLRGVLRIEELALTSGWSVGLFLNELALRTTRRYLVALAGREVVGFGGIMFSGPDGHITTIATRPDVQGRHVGRRIMLGLVQAARAEGCANLTLEVRAGNEAALALYATFGLAPAGVRKGYYPPEGTDPSGPRVDAVIMWAHDLDQPAYADRLAHIEATTRGRTTHERLAL